MIWLARRVLLTALPRLVISASKCLACDQPSRIIGTGIDPKACTEASQGSLQVLIAILQPALSDERRDVGIDTCHGGSIQMVDRGRDVEAGRDGPGQTHHHRIRSQAQVCLRVF